MSVPRPAIFVAIVTAPGRPACAMIPASCSWCFAFCVGGARCGLVGAALCPAAPGGRSRAPKGERGDCVGPRKASGDVSQRPRRGAENAGNAIPQRSLTVRGCRAECRLVASTPAGAANRTRRHWTSAIGGRLAGMSSRAPSPGPGPAARRVTARTSADDAAPSPGSRVGRVWWSAWSMASAAPVGSAGWDVPVATSRARRWRGGSRG